MEKNELIQRIKEIDWEFSNEDTQYLSHNIHRYSGKFIPQIARSVIDLFTDEDEIVLDPYLGSGTTALEAIISGRRSIGTDINPLAILISEVKTTVLPVAQLEKFRADFVNSLDVYFSEQLSIFPTTCKPSEINPKLSERYLSEWNNKWYQLPVLRQLITIYSMIENIDDERLKKIAQVAFSDILRKSSNASSRFPNVMYDKNHKEKPLPLKNYIDSFNDVVNKVIATSKKLANNTIHNEIITCNNTDMPLPENSVDAIITHPPYVAAVPYAEYGCLSLNWLGYDSKELDSVITGGKRHRKDVAIRFEEDYSLMIKESFRVLRPGRYAFFMVGNPTANGEVVDLHEMTKRLAEEHGYEYVYTETRKGSNRRGNNMGVEYLEFFRKPL